MNQGITNDKVISKVKDGTEVPPYTEEESYSERVEYKYKRKPGLFIGFCV